MTRLLFLVSTRFATFVVTERESKAKHLQTVAGVKPSAYWLSTLLWDFANYCIPAVITIILCFIFDVNSLTTTDNGVLGAFLVLLFLFGPAAAAFSYCVTFLFKNASLCKLPPAEDKVGRNNPLSRSLADNHQATSSLLLVGSF